VVLDTDKNGFFDQIQYDLDGDTLFERTVSLKDLQIDDKQNIIKTSELDYSGFQAAKLTEELEQAQAIDVARSMDFL
jgi:hypothetical protein